MKTVLLFLLVIVTAGCGGSNQPHQPQYPTTFPENSCNPAPHFMPAGIVPRNSDAALFRAKFQSRLPIAIAIVGDSTTFGTGSNGMPNAVELLDEYVRTKNSSSVIYNYGLGYAQASVHLSYGTVATVSSLTPKPDAVIIALGINDTVNKYFERQEMELLVSQIRANNMLPVLAHENNISCMNRWEPSPFWQFVRNETARLAIEYNIDVIDLGSSDGAVDTTFLSDAAHPNPAGYKRIFEKYLAWLEN